VVAARPLLCAQTHIGDGAGREARGVVGSERALPPGRCRGQEKDGRSFWRCAIGDST
jgi:hypothetical protein